MYRLEPNGRVLRLRDMASIPPDERNADWRVYQDWLSAGGSPQPASPVPEPAPARDLAAEIDDLKARVDQNQTERK